MDLDLSVIHSFDLSLILSNHAANSVSYAVGWDGVPFARRRRIEPLETGRELKSRRPFPIGPNQAKAKYHDRRNKSCTNDSAFNIHDESNPAKGQKEGRSHVFTRAGQGVLD
jgi:hypothetical protein